MIILLIYMASFGFRIQALTLSEMQQMLQTQYIFDKINNNF